MSERHRKKRTDDPAPDPQTIPPLQDNGKKSPHEPRLEAAYHTFQWVKARAARGLGG
jgi:hypothetical protein